MITEKEQANEQFKLHAWTVRNRQLSMDERFNAFLTKSMFASLFLATFILVGSPA